MERKNIVIDYIRERIESGEWKKGDKIKSENILSKELGVSRVTVREALSVLAEENLIEKHHGSGTFVKNGAKKYVVILINEDRIMSLLEMMYKYYVDRLKKKLSEMGFIPMVFIFQENNLKLEEYINVPVNETFAVIYFDSIKDMPLDIYRLNQVPIIICGSVSPLEVPSVYISNILYVHSIIELIKKHKYKNVLVFSYNLAPRNDRLWMVSNYYLMEYIRNNYDLCELNFRPNERKIREAVKNKLNSLTEKPDVIVFFDDTIYKYSSLIFEKYKNIFENTDIISHINKQQDYMFPFPVCRVEIDLDLVVDRTVMLVNNISKGNVLESYELIPEIKGEEYLKS